MNRGIRMAVYYYYYGFTDKGSRVCLPCETDR